ncbi:MAG TPA: proline dehydrogenase family protein, partial [Planctomycetota bacterium]|nr:proline dehydrogenase family protein [Planctomycetota bacterium]
MNALDRVIVALLPAVPKPVVRKIADRYIAGETIDDAVAEVRGLNGEGCEATVDVLGEFVTAFEEAEATAREYRELLERIRSEGLRSNVSIKLTALGLKVDAERCYGLVRDLVARARELSNFVRIDMEDSSVTTATLDLYRRLRAERFDNTGVVIQAYLRRSAADVASLLPLRPSIRLCKGIYVEPPEIAFRARDDVRTSYRALLRQMFDGGCAKVGIATHDPSLVEDARAVIAER